LARHKAITNLFSFPEWTASRKLSHLSYETTLLREYDTTLVVLGELKPSR
jgi:hypothetical protein